LSQLGDLICALNPLVPACPSSGYTAEFDPLEVSWKCFNHKKIDHRLSAQVTDERRRKRRRRYRRRRRS